MTPAMEVPSGFESRFSQIEHVVETGSTNADLLERARSGESAEIVLIADHQRAGRGRQGRVWFDRPGASLLMSVLLHPPQVQVDRGDLGLVPLVAGLAVRDAFAELGAGLVGLKWPNDVLVTTDRGERKLVGILCEATTTPGGLAAVVGIGANLNLNLDPNLDPNRDLGPTSSENRTVGEDRTVAEVADVAADLGELIGAAPDRHVVARSVLSALAMRLEQLDIDRPAVLDAYRDACVSIGRTVNLDHPAGPVTGVVAGIAGDGGLVLSTETGEKVFQAGAVHHRPNE